MWYGWLSAYKVWTSHNITIYQSTTPLGYFFNRNKHAAVVSRHVSRYDVLFDCPAVQDDVASKSWISSSDINRMCPWISFASYWIQVVVGAGFDYWHPKFRSFGTRLFDELSQHVLLRSCEEPWVGWSTWNRRRHEGKQGEGKGQWPMAMIFWVDGTIHVVTTSCMTMKKLVPILLAHSWLIIN